MGILTAFVDVSLCDINRTKFLAEKTVLREVESESSYKMQINFKFQRAKYPTQASGGITCVVRQIGLAPAIQGRKADHLHLISFQIPYKGT